MRTQEEFAEGHIENAVCIPVETIENDMPEEFPDLSQKIPI
ncbi:MAG: rhodanese-like domain-containing protein [Clostridia bacterium]|nr:rhodanese-like domain-containing protein [Clostridia bacterium]